LRKYAYLSNDSSYSISIEDGVDISLLDNSSSDDDKKILDYMHEQSDVLNSSDSENDSNRLQSFTFESQVFLFYFIDAVLLASVLIVICHLGFKFP
jgi:vacuolar protein sorting-associated protein 13A/C